jgi:hypothetical protein
MMCDCKIFKKSMGGNLRIEKLKNKEVMPFETIV